jgi:predicted site-specific integrase-resolvase
MKRKHQHQHETSEPGEALWTSAQLADHLNISPRSLEKMRAAGRIPFIRLSATSVRYRPAEIQAWLSKRSTGRAA